MIKILVVEDDENLNQAVCKHLSLNGYNAIGSHTAEHALDLMSAELFDLVVSDIMMPQMDGFRFAASIREFDKNIPIIFVTARDDFASKERGYSVCIDDYMTKPIDLDELLLHITALLRRAKISSDKKLVIGNLTLDEDGTSAELDGKSIALTLREFQIIYTLLSYPKKTFTRGQLLDRFNGLETESDLRSIDVHVANLRRKLADADGFEIVTIRGLGYKAVIL